MNTKTRMILDEVRTLPRDEQLALAEQLIASLDIDETDPDAALLPELEHRWAAYERGDDPGEEAGAAVADIRASLRTRAPR
ncbi:MAG TPA: addiction module protein [Hyphomicrobium sp.]|nr:addiction module protein [Hyphomicrobium sp.]